MTVELVVLERVQAQKGCDAKENAAVESQQNGRVDKKEDRCVDDLRVEDAQCHDPLAGTAAVTALAGRIERSLSSKGRQPDDAVESVNGDHDVWLGETARPGIARRANQVDPCWY